MYGGEFHGVLDCEGVGVPELRVLLESFRGYLGQSRGRGGLGCVLTV